MKKLGLRLEAFMFSLLIVCLGLSMAACGGDDDEPDDVPVLNYTGTSTYRYPLFYWNQTMKFIEGKETRELMEKEDDALWYAGTGNVEIIFYDFENKKMDACGMMVEGDNLEGFLKALLIDFEPLTTEFDDNGYLYLESGDQKIVCALGVVENYVVAGFAENTDARGGVRFDAAVQITKTMLNK